MYITIPGPKCNAWFEPIITDTPREAIATLLEWWFQPDCVSIEGTKMQFIYFDDDKCDEEFYIAKLSDIVERK